MLLAVFLVEAIRGGKPCHDSTARPRPQRPSCEEVAEPARGGRQRPRRSKAPGALPAFALPQVGPQGKRARQRQRSRHTGWPTCV